jgi:Protease subunit of ATP-dependent Clp proteases
MERRFLTLSGDITEENVAKVSRTILEYNMMDDEQENEKKNYERSPIKLIINSYGGNAYDGLGLGELISKSKTPVHTICIGEAMSSAFMIFICGHKRFCYENTTFLYHQLIQRVSGNIEKIERILKEDKRMMDIVYKIVLSKTKLTKEQLDENFEKKIDWYISSEEALKYGIVDEIMK